MMWLPNFFFTGIPSPKFDSNLLFSIVIDFLPIGDTLKMIFHFQTGYISVKLPAKKAPPPRQAARLKGDNDVKKELILSITVL
jgi:hypothetical protein